MAATHDRGARWSALLGLLAQHGRLSVTEVVESLGVSEATVRRDFADLAAQQLVTRTHGGIVATAVAYDLPARYKQAGTDDAKDRIAAYAADLALEGSVVGFNGGTTTSAVARRPAARSDLAMSSRRPAVTVVTNALNIATEMVLRPFIRCVSLGGVARPESYELSGPLAAMGPGRAVARHRLPRRGRRLGHGGGDVPPRGRGRDQRAHGRALRTCRRRRHGSQARHPRLRPHLPPRCASTR